jgi:hypothetical protein
MQGTQGPVDIISLYPNPITKGNSLKVDYKVRSNQDNLSLEVIDAQGKQQLSFKLPSAIGEQTAELPINGASGEYFVVLRAGNVGAIRKVILK